MSIAISEKKTAAVEVVSDAICPWCWVGKRRLEKALSLTADQVQATIQWRPFQLNPDTPQGGYERHEYLARKFGPVRVQQMHEHLSRVGELDGVPFHFERIQRVPNTFDAHRLGWLAGSRSNVVAEALFSAYFAEGQDIADPETLVRIGVECGLEEADVRRMLETRHGQVEVQRELAQAARLGIHGVPTFIVNGHMVASGAQPPEVLASAILQLAVAEPVTGTVCTPETC